GAKIGEIPGEASFTVLEGPVCADGFNWWRVNYDGLEGWTVEGQGTEYWVEPFDPTLPSNTPPPPTPLPSPTPTLAPARVFEPPSPVVNILEAGVQARVINDDFNSTEVRLTVRSEPGVDGTVVTRLEAGVLVKILEGVQEADGYIWRELQTADGQTGWTIEGLWNAETERYERTLLPSCPFVTERIAFFFGRYIYTADADGSNACVLDHLNLPELYTFYSYYVYLPNKMVWSPDRTTFAYIDFPDINNTNQELFVLSADGMTRRQMTDNGDVYWVDWSPDGERLLFSQSINGRGEPQIWTMKIDGSAYGALTSGDNRKLWGGWLPDSETLVYVENIGEPTSQMGPTAQEFIFYTVNVVSGGLTEIYRTTLNLFDTQLAPDRSTLLIRGWETEAIAGTEFREYSGSDTVLLDLETGETALLTGRLASNLIWLPDSSGLVGITDDAITRSPLTSAEPTIVPRAPSPLDEDFYTFYIDWLPNGQLVILSGGEEFISTDDNALLSLNIETGELTTLIAPR
ncbi:MAG: SH3 domain-containing protein, partial [Armatimonadetes bacterium]|nr:SH3 domain-containing protein [Anaerolineae bacterium]